MPSPVFSNYYVANDLSGIGAQMQQNRGLQAQVQMAQVEQQRLQHQALQQALMQQRAQQQQAQQFQQELAMRQQGQSRENAYREALLGMRRSDSVRDDTYRYAALDNALKQIQAQAQIQDPRLAVADRIQGEKERQDNAIALENWEFNATESKAKAATFNALVRQYKNEAKTIEGKMGFNQKKNAEDHFNTKIAELNARLLDDKTPGKIVLNASGDGFVGLLPPKPYAGTSKPYNPLTDTGPAGQPPVGSLSGPSVNTPIKFRSSTGGVFDAPANQWGNIQREDPGAVLITTNRPGQGSRGVGGSWEAAPRRPAQPNSLWGALYGNAKDFYGGAYNQAMDSAGTALQPAVTPVMDYYQQLIDMLNERNPPQ